MKGVWVISTSGEKVWLEAPAVPAVLVYDCTGVHWEIVV